MYLDQPLVSIITVVYNNVHGINSTIESVLNQTYKNIEYIIIDGGSNDGTVEILKNYNNRIHKWISESDKGIYDAMNKGIVMSNGTWIGILNSGDTYLNDGIENLVEGIQQDSQLVSGDMKYINPNNDQFIVKAYNCNLNEDISRYTNQSCSIIKREIYDLYGLYDINYAIYADFDFFKRIRKDAVTVNIPQVISNFYVGGISSSYSYKNLIISIREIYRIIDPSTLNGKIRIAKYTATILLNTLLSFFVTKRKMVDVIFNRHCAKAV